LDGVLANAGTQESSGATGAQRFGTDECRIDPGVVLNRCCCVAETVGDELTGDVVPALVIGVVVAVKLVGWSVNLLRRLGSGCTISWMLYPTRGKQQSPLHSQTSCLGMVVIAEVIYSYRCCVSFIVVDVLLPTDMSPIPVTRTRDACHFTATVATRTDSPCGHRLSDKCGSFLAPQPLSQILFLQCNMRHKLSEVSLSLVPELRVGRCCAVTQNTCSAG
jgi:hypothetical protein